MRHERLISWLLHHMSLLLQPADDVTAHPPTPAPPNHQIGTPPCIKDILIPYFSVFNVVKVFKRLMPSYESSDWMISVQAVASRSDQRVAAAPHAFSGTRALLPTDVHAVAMRFASYLLQLAVLVPFIGVWVTNLNDTVPIMWFVFFT